MNATQSKILLAASRQALALLNPEWRAYRELQEALREALAKPAPKAIVLGYKGTHCAICYQGLSDKPFPSCYGQGGDASAWGYKPISFDTFPEGVKTRVKADAVHESCLAYYEANNTPEALKAFWDAWDRELAARSTKPVDKTALEYCACGHHASEHKQDEMDNLLACGYVELEHGVMTDNRCSCDHFHYAIVEDESEAA